MRKTDVDTQSVRKGSGTNGRLRLGEFIDVCDLILCTCKQNIEN